MNLKQIYLIFIFMMVLIFCAGAVSAASNDTVISEVASTVEPISTVSDQAVSVDEQENTLAYNEINRYESVNNNSNDVVNDNVKQVASSEDNLKYSNEVNATLSADGEGDADNSSSEVVETTKIKDYPVSFEIQPGIVGQYTTLTVTVPADVTGKVVIIINGKGVLVPTENGIARLNLLLPADTYTASARLIDDLKYLDSKTDKTFEVEKISDYEITLDVQSKDGKTVFTVHVPKDATGDVLILVSGKPYNLTVRNGIATLILNLAPGKYVASAYLVNDPKYALKQSNKVSFTVDDSADEKNLSSNPVKEKTGTLKDYPTGNPVLLALLVVMSMGGLPLRRIKK